MNWIAIVLLPLFLPTCTVTIVTDAPKKKPAVHSKATHSKKKKASTPATTKANVKETWWVENYHKLEAAHNYTIPDDANIEPLPDGRFKVPDEVLTHYQDLLLATKPKNEH